MPAPTNAPKKNWVKNPTQPNGSFEFMLLTYIRF
jgi:hypothetical protein